MEKRESQRVAYAVVELQVARDVLAASGQESRSLRFASGSSVASSAQFRGAKPLLVERDALRRVHRAVEELRERGQDADWLRALIEYLDDVAVRRSPAVQQGLAEMAAGHLEPA